MKKLLILHVIVFIFLLQGWCMAEEKQTEEGTQISMEEVVVTATRHEEQISSVPANVTIIDENDIENSTAHNIPDLLRTQVGIHVNDIAGNRRYYSIDIRGFGETAPLNTLVLVDGRRINQPDLSGTDWTLIPLDRIKRIEIIRGGRGSILYGDNAAGGVINIITREGDVFKAGGGVNAGSYETFKGSAYTSGSKNNLSYALSGSYLNSNGYRDNSDTEAKDLGAKLGYYIGDFVKFNLSSGYHQDSTGLPGPIKKSDFAGGISRTDSLTPDDFADTEDYYFAGGPEIFILNDSLCKIDFSFRKRNFSSFASFSGGTFEGDTEIDTVSVSPQMLFKEKLMGFNNSLTFGYDYMNSKENIKNKSVFFGFPSEGEFDLEKKSYGYYFHDEFKLLDNLALSAGYRHDRAEFNFDPSTPDHATMDKDLYTGGINYNFFEKSHVYFSFSRSFRYPALDELFNFFTNTIDPGLVPQTSDDYEAGVRHYFTENLRAGINFFRIDTEDEIYYDPNTFTNGNLDEKIRRDGMEVSIKKIYKSVTLGGSYTYTDATVIDGQYEGKDWPGVPQHKATLETLFSLGRGFTLGINGIYIGKRPFIGDFSNDFSNQKDYIVINTKLMHNWKYLSSFLNINNITSEEYSEYGAIGGFPIVEEAFYPSPKINFLLGMSAGF